MSELPEDFPEDLLEPAKSPNELGQFDGISLIDFIDKGAYGYVFRAPQDRAVKIRNPLARDPRATDRIRREGRLLSRVSHPNVVQIVKFGSVPRRKYGAIQYLVMEYVEGPSLKEWIQRHSRLSPSVCVSQTTEIAKGLASGLAALNAYGIIHRDLKPSNIKLASETIPKILDLGLALPYSDGTRPDETRLSEGAVGTPRYMAPEQYEMRACHQSDVFSLGTVIFEMLAGVNPWVGTTTLFARPRPLDQLNQACPPMLSALVSRMIELKLEDRCKSAKYVLAYLHHLAESPSQRVTVNLSATLHSGNSATEGSDCVSLGEELDKAIYRFHSLVEEVQLFDGRAIQTRQNAMEALSQLSDAVSRFKSSRCEVVQGALQAIDAEVALLRQAIDSMFDSSRGNDPLELEQGLCRKVDSFAKKLDNEISMDLLRRQIELEEAGTDFVI
jgi:serine/threonine protein kinase